MPIRGSDWQLYVSSSNKKMRNWIINEYSMFNRQNLPKHESQWMKNDDKVLYGRQVGIHRCGQTPL